MLERILEVRVIERPELNVHAEFRRRWSCRDMTAPGGEVIATALVEADKESNVTFSFSCSGSRRRNPGAAMESFVHLRKGKTPRHLHADLDGLKDDELGRGGCTGRTANLRNPRRYALLRRSRST